MSTGEFIFFMGIGLLVFTIILGVIFWLKRPQYIPGNMACGNADCENTQKLRSGSHTNRLTIRHEPDNAGVPGTIILHEEPERLAEEQTELLSGTAVSSGTENPGGQRTEKLHAGAVLLFEETTLLQQAQGTVPLHDSPQSPVGETVILGSEDLGTTENFNETTPISGD